MMNEPPRYRSDNRALEELFCSGADPWRFGSDLYERKRIARTAAACRKVPHRSIVEIGCAEGHMTAALTAIAERVVALDVAPTAVARTRAAAPAAEVLIGSMESFATRERFDLAVCAEALYYCADLSLAVRRLCTLADFVLITYTIYERRKLDRLLAEVPLLHDEVVRGVGFWNLVAAVTDSSPLFRNALGRAVGRWGGRLRIRGSRLLLFRSSDAILVQSTQTRLSPVSSERRFCRDTSGAPGSLIDPAG
jgi:SAM-dependent methyltransferase